MGKFFRILIKNHHTAWAYYVPMIQDIINEACHDITEYIPYELHFNKEPSRLWDNWVPKSGLQTISHEEKNSLARTRMLKAADKRKRKHDETNKNLFRTFSIGDEVLLKANNVSDNEKKRLQNSFRNMKAHTQYQGHWVRRRTSSPSVRLKEANFTRTT